MGITWKEYNPVRMPRCSVPPNRSRPSRGKNFKAGWTKSMACSKGTSRRFAEPAEEADRRTGRRPRVYGASSAGLGLVDKIGTLEDAIKFVAAEAKIEKYEVRVVPEPKSLLERLLRRHTAMMTRPSSPGRVPASLQQPSLFSAAQPYLRGLDPQRCKSSNGASGNLRSYSGGGGPDDAGSAARRVVQDRTNHPPRTLAQGLTAATGKRSISRRGAHCDDRVCMQQFPRHSTKMTTLLAVLAVVQVGAAAMAAEAARFLPNTKLTAIPENSWEKVAGFPGRPCRHSCVLGRRLRFGQSSVSHLRRWPRRLLGDEFWPYSPGNLSWRRMYEPDSKARYTNDNIDNAHGKLKDSDRPYTRHTFRISSALCRVQPRCSCWRRRSVPGLG